MDTEQVLHKYGETSRSQPEEHCNLKSETCSSPAMPLRSRTGETPWFPLLGRKGRSACLREPLGGSKRETTLKGNRENTPKPGKGKANKWPLTSLKGGLNFKSRPGSPSSFCQILRMIPLKTSQSCPCVSLCIGEAGPAGHLL